MAPPTKQNEPSPVRQAVLQHLNIVGHLQPALHVAQHAPYPDGVDNAHVRAYLRSPHDVGGEPDVPIRWEEKQEEVWELNTYVTCEVLGWRGIWTSEERRRRQNVDVGQTQYLGLPYYGRWLMTAARIMVDKRYITLTELINKLDEVKKRYDQKKPSR